MFFKYYALCGIFLLVQSPQANSQYASLPSGNPAPQEGSPAALIGQAAGRIESGDLEEASSLLEEARQEAGRTKDNATKNRARDGLQRIKRFYEPFYDGLSRAENLQRQGEMVPARQSLQDVLKLVEENKANGLPEFADLDRRLEERARSEYENLERQRISLYQDRVRIGEQLYLQRDYEKALQALQEARNLLIQDQERGETDRVNGLQRQAAYQQYLAAGDRLVQEEKFEEALDAYRQAQDLQDDPTVQEKLGEAATRVHYKLLQEGQSAFYAGHYRESSDILSEAAIYQSSDYLDRIRQNAYRQMTGMGDSAYDNGNFEQALEYYQQARLFIDDEAVRANIDRVSLKTESNAALTKADALIQKDKLKQARRELENVPRGKDSPGVRERLAQLDDYGAKISQGNGMLKIDPTAAYQAYAAAYRIFPTAEARKGMDKAGAKKGTAPGTTEDFFH